MDNYYSGFVYDGAIPGSFAEKSDLCHGDKLLSLNGVPLMEIGDFQKGIDANRSQRVLEVLRGTELMTITIKLFHHNVNETDINLN